jgi:general secretion pathway protein A
MYVPFFGLSQEPFSIAPDPRFLFMSEMHREALAHLLYGLGGGGGFVLLTGEIGAGKTTVCRAFLEQLQAHCAVAYIFNPRLTAVELLQAVCDEFAIATPAGASLKQLVDALNAFLLQAHAQGRQGVLIIDEAQSLSADVLEQLRLLTNLETSQRKLLQIVLIGQPELRAMLGLPGLEQLAQRVIARYHLPALDAAQTVQYVQHRWAVAGARRADGGAVALPFEPAALRQVHRLTRGVPRRINLLCDRALLGAYAQGRATVNLATLRTAAAEAFGALDSARRPLALPLAAAGVLVAGGVVGWWMATWQAPAVAGAPVAPVVARAAAPAVAAVPAAASVTSVALAAPAPAQPPLADAAPVLAGAFRTESQAWRALALRWGLAVAAGDPCQAAATAGVLCWRGGDGLDAVRQLDRPGLLVLRDPAGRALYAELVALADDRVTLQAGGARWVLGLAALAPVWRGEFATLWRTPPGWRLPLESAQPPQAIAWVQGALDRTAPVAVGTPLRSQVQAFQVAQGLVPDGVAGPLTLIRLNRAVGVDEPRLDR